MYPTFQTHTLSFEGLGDGDGTYRIAPEHWRETPKGLLASHTTPSGARLKVKLVLTGASPTGTLTLTHPPRKARYTLNETTGSGVYSGLAEKTGQTVRVTVDEDTRTLTLLEEDQPPRTLTVDPEHWHLNHTKGAKHLRFAAEAAGLTLHGALHLGKDGRVGGHLKLREGKRQKSRYALTARPTPCGPAGLFYIHTDHLGTPQSLTDETQQVVWAADYQPFGEATFAKENVTFNLRFPGQYFDSETGLHYNYYRDYDSTTGRYIQSDPIGLAGGINTYAYVGANTLRWIDPFGLTQRDIDEARRLAEKSQPDLKFPPQDRFSAKDLSWRGPDVVGLTSPGAGTIIDDRYLKPLSDASACDLLNTIIHESVHWTLPRNSPLQDDNNSVGFAYDEAERRTTPALCEELSRERKRPCE